MDKQTEQHFDYLMYQAEQHLKALDEAIKNDWWDLLDWSANMANKYLNEAEKLL